MLHTLLIRIAQGLFVLIGVSLMIFAALMIVVTYLSLARSVIDQEVFIYEILNSVGSTIIGVAILDLAKFVLEEELVRGNQLRTVREVRESLTKFMTIIVIAVSLEALVMVFRISGKEEFEEIVYPVALMLTAVLALVALGLFQWLARQTERRLPGEREEA